MSKARKALPAIQKKNAAETARQRAMSPSVARGRDFAGYRKALVSANARKVQAAAAKKGGGSPLDAITSFFQGRVDLATGKAPTHISTSGNHTPVVPLVKDELRKIKKAGK
ncbi:MAG: hypothetical protein FIA92_02785 [Chloroflexi bacterium]|nr:hypothetical protein [Chloroflexota bacterium]